jgi:hypothetical protein
MAGLLAAIFVTLAGLLKALACGCCPPAIIMIDQLSRRMGSVRGQHGSVRPGGVIASTRNRSTAMSVSETKSVPETRSR